MKNCDPRFAVFPQGTDDEKRLFELLRRAYVDARYKMEEYRHLGIKTNQQVVGFLTAKVPN